MILPPFSEVKSYYDTKKYSFDLKKFYEFYRNKNTNDWRKLVDTIQRNGLMIDDNKTSLSTPDFESTVYDKPNDYEAIFRDLFGVRADDEYRKFKENCEMDDQIIEEWKAQRRTPIWSGDVENERERRKADLKSLEDTFSGITRR